MTKQQLAQLIHAYGSMRIQIELAERGVVFEETGATYQRMARVTALLEQEIGHKIEGPVYDNPNDCVSN